MINPKNICISACIGFFLSFFIGLISDVKFSHVLLRAFLFALLFAALCVGVSFLYQKFLSADVSSSFGDGDSVIQKNPANATGSAINIVVDDSNLPDDGMSPKFNVSQNQTGPITQENAKTSAPLSPATEKIEQQAERAVSDSENASFKPLGLESVASQSSAISSPPRAENLSSVSQSGGNAPISQVENASPVASESQASSEIHQDSGDNAEKLDELPDMGTLDTIAAESSAMDNSFESSSAEIVDDTEFSTGGKHLKEQPISGDTNVMAKAIQTLLAKDNS